MEERYAVTQAASDGYRLDPETGEMIPIEDAEAEEIRDEATVQAEGAAMPNESLPPLPTQEAWQPAGQDWAEFGAWQEERERRFMEDYPPSPEMYGYAEPRRTNGRGRSSGEGAGRYIGDASGTRRTGCPAGNIRTCGYGTRCTAGTCTRSCLGARASVHAGNGTVCR